MIVQLYSQEICLSGGKFRNAEQYLGDKKKLGCTSWSYWCKIACDKSTQYCKCDTKQIVPERSKPQHNWVLSLKAVLHIAEFFLSTFCRWTYSEKIITNQMLLKYHLWKNWIAYERGKTHSSEIWGPGYNVLNMVQANHFKECTFECICENR